MKKANTKMQKMKTHTFFFIMALACLLYGILFFLSDLPTMAIMMGVIGIFFGLGATQSQDAYHIREREQREEDRKVNFNTLYGKYEHYKVSYNLPDTFTYSDYKKLVVDAEL